VTRRRLTALLLVAACVGVGAYLALSGGGRRQPPRTAEAGRRARAGIEVALQDDPVFVRRDYFDRDAAFGRARQLGATWLRVNALWARVAGRSATRSRAPARPVYDWTSYDVAVTAARAHGMNVEMTLTGPAPAWATRDGRVGVDRPDARLFAGFARAAATHFRGLVHRYSIWNEPNHVAWIAPLGAAPSVYRRLYEAGWSAIRSADPRAAVLIGETASFARPGKVVAPLRFLRAVACATPTYRPAGRCRPLRSDGYAHHPYDFAGPPERSYPGVDNVTIGTLDRLAGALDRLAAARLLSTPGGRALPVYLTEFGYFRSGPRALAPATRAAYLGRAFEIAARGYPRVRQMLQYLLVSPPPGYPGGWFDTSVVSRAGAPEPAFESLRRWARTEPHR
jgi:hypothetical protein